MVCDNQLQLYNFINPNNVYRSTTQHVLTIDKLLQTSAASVQ